MQESRRRRRLELCLLSLRQQVRSISKPGGSAFGAAALAGLLLASCIHLPSSNTAPAVDAEPSQSQVSDANGATVYVSSSANDRGLSAFSIGLANAFAVRAQSVRALPELKPPRLEPWATLLPPVEDSDTEMAADEPSSTAGRDGSASADHDNEEVHAELASLPRGTMVLHVGDSFAGALGVPLGKRLRAAGLRSVLEFKKASYIPTWAFGDELRIYVARHKPDLVLVSLGANEIELRKPLQRVYAIKQLVKTVSSQPCVWVSPPTWKPDAGLLAVIRENIAPCRYLDSDALVPYLPRGPDSIHPSLKGREIWADAVLDWLSRERDPEGQAPWQFKSSNSLHPSARYDGGFPARSVAQP
jgi:hypothetical protein